MSLIGAFVVPHPPLIVSQIGKGKQKEIQKTIDAYQQVGRRTQELKPDTIIITSPHSIMYADYLHISPGERASGDFGDFGAPDVAFKVKYDSDFVERLCRLAEEELIPAGTLGERYKKLDHSTMVPLYFVNQYYLDYCLVRIGISGLSPLVHYRFGKCIVQAADESNKRVLFIASGDLSHKLTEDGPYGIAEEGPVFDRQLTEALVQGDFLRLMTFNEEFCEAAAECGLRSFLIMAGALDGKKIKPQLLSYEGPLGVGYAVASFDIIGNDDNRHFDQIYEQAEMMRLQETQTQEDNYVQLARQSLEHYVKTGRQLQRPDDLPDELLQHKAGVFVSIKISGRLRGCIGTIAPVTDNTADEIIRDAVSACSEDPRFEPVRPDELPWLEYSVDVLGEAEPIESIDQLDVIRYGVIVSSRGRRGLLLPDLAGVNTPQKQVSIALQKAGISSHDKYSLERFEVVRHK